METGRYLWIPTIEYAHLDHEELMKYQTLHDPSPESEKERGILKMIYREI
jgi:hypothetical protein